MDIVSISSMAVAVDRNFMSFVVVFRLIFVCDDIDSFDENGNAIIDENAAPWTAQQYLESLAFGEKTIQVNGKTASFDFDAELIVA